MPEQYPPGNSASAREAFVPRRSYLWWGLGLLGVVMAFAFSSFVMKLMGTIERQDRQLRRTLDSLHVLLARRETVGEELLHARAAFTAVLESAGEPAILTGSSLAPRASGRLLVSPVTGSAVLIVAGLPPDGAKEYVLRSRGFTTDDSLGSFSVRDTAVHAFLFARSGLRPGSAVVTAENPARVVLAGADYRRAFHGERGSESRLPNLP